MAARSFFAPRLVFSPRAWRSECLYFLHRFFHNVGKGGEGDVVGSLDTEVAECGWLAVVEVDEGAIVAEGAPGAGPAPHVAETSLLHKAEGGGVAEGGGEAAAGFGFGDGDGVAVGPGDGDGWVVGVGVVWGLYECGLVVGYGLLVAGVDDARCRRRRGGEVGGAGWAEVCVADLDGLVAGVGDGF